MLIYGKQVFLHILRNHKELIKEVILSKELDKPLFREVALLNKKIVKIDNKKAQSLSQGKNHQGYFLEIEDYPLTPIDKLKDLNFLLVLVKVTDVGNIGAIVRSAYALGVDGIIATEVSTLNMSAIARASAGALFESKFAIYKNTLDLINELKFSNFELIGADMSGSDVRLGHFAPKKVLFLGSEDEGLSGKIVRKLDKKVSIVMSKSFDSLNVNSAASILIDRIR
jgi:23S rRNA (guanosine2251-2'-O)-methyltransferase